MQNKLHLYTGKGKGKTTAAAGLALRSAGHGRRVLFAQFMKDGRSGELIALGKLGNVTVMPAKPISGFTFSMTEDELKKTRAEQTEHAEKLIKLIEELKPDMTVFDELAVAAGKGLVDENTARKLIETALKSGETAVTGRKAPEWIRQMSDYVSVIEPEKHPYASEGLPAREGIEW